MIQRYMALKNVKAAKTSQIIYVVGITMMTILCVYNGLLLYANYHNCDPLTTKLAKTGDQLLPLLVIDTFQGLPGLSGMFISGIFSAALSSLSTGLNAMSAVVLEDFVKPFAKEGVSDKAASFIMRGTVLVLGFIVVCMAYVVQHLGTVLQLSMSLPTACFGPLLGIFFIGFTLPWIGKRAVLYGSVVGCVSLSIIVFKAQFEMAQGHARLDYKPLSTDGCSYNFTKSKTEPTFSSDEPGKSIYQISYLYYTLFGSAVVVISSFVLSFVFGFQDPTAVDSKLLVPCLRKYFKTKDETPGELLTELTFKQATEKDN